MNKYEILTKANELIDLLEQCDDWQLVDEVIAHITSADRFEDFDNPYGDD